MVIPLLLSHVENHLINLVKIDLNLFSRVSLCKFIELVGDSALISHLIALTEVDAVGVVDRFGCFDQLFVVADQG